MLDFLTEGWRMLSRAHRLPAVYDGDAQTICRRIVVDCWNGTFFQTSLGHFRQLYVRDLAFCVDGLLGLGYRQEVEKTLQYALSIFASHGKITTTITPSGKPIDVFSYTPESVALLLHSMRLFPELVKQYRDLIDKEVNKAFEVFDQNLGLLRKGTYFSSIKDHAVRDSSCYNNCMLAMLSADLDLMGLDNPFRSYDIKQAIKNHFWTGSYFLDDLSGKRYVAGDANVFPFWCGVFDDKQMFASCLNSIQREGLDKPWPLKYTQQRQKTLFPFNILQPDYESDAIWMHLGGCFLQVVKKYTPEQCTIYFDQFTAVIKKHKNYLELFNPDGSIYRNLFYQADEGMLWAAQYLLLRP